MNQPNYISDQEFLPFLQSLGVESDRSFEWLFNDPEISGVLHWLYNNLDHSNTLSAREKSRFAEIEPHILSSEDLDNYIVSLQEEYPGLCLPGDQEALQDAKMDVQMQSERLKMLEKQEGVIRDLVKQNELAKEELSREITKLNSAQHQLAQDEETLTEECLTLATELDSLTEGVVDVISNGLSMYSDAHADKEIAKKFLSFGRFGSYKQAQDLFKSHFDLYVSRKFNKQSHAVTDEDLRCALVEANVMGDRLTKAAFTYIKAKTQLAGEQAKLALVTNYQSEHPSSVPDLSLDEQAAIDLKQAEPVLDLQIQDAVKDFVEARTRLATEATAQSALAVRERMLADATLLLDVSQRALGLDHALYSSLRAELRNMQEFLQLTSQFKQYYTAEGAAAADRIKSMNKICCEQETCERRLESSDELLDTFCTTSLGVKSNDALLLKKAYCDLRAGTNSLKENLYESFESREQALVDFQKSTTPLRQHIWDGCTKLPNSCNPAAAAMTHALNTHMEAVERQVDDVAGLFVSVKNGDEQGLRKLWQYFLTDTKKLAAAMKAAETRTFT